VSDYEVVREHGEWWKIVRSDGAVFSPGSTIRIHEEWLRGAAHVLSGGTINFVVPRKPKPEYAVVKNGDYYGVRGPKGVSICPGKRQATERCRVLTEGLYRLTSDDYEWTESIEGWKEVE